jgi:hypothetical protein
MTYLPPRIPNPKKDAERRAQLWSSGIRAALWIAVIPPLLFVLMAYGYSDQSPAALRQFTVALDGALGQPVWSIIAPSGK